MLYCLNVSVIVYCNAKIFHSNIDGNLCTFSADIKCDFAQDMCEWRDQSFGDFGFNWDRKNAMYLTEHSLVKLKF